MFKNEIRRLMVLLAVLALAFAVGCSDDDPTDPTGNTGQAPDFGGPEVYTVPSAMQSSSDPYALQAYGYATQVNLAALYVSFLNAPGKAAADGPPWVESFNYNGLTIELTVDEDGDDWTYEARLSGSVGEASYDNDLVYRAREAKDGSAGFLDFLDPDSDTVLTRWDWSGSGTSMIFYDSGVPAGAYVVTPDGSGGADLDIWSDGIASNGGWLMMAMTWNAAGVGSWTQYDDTGTPVDSGSWPTSR